ncbi:hypothetical protein JX265_003307 [Neoarthrinium moseri]|uniref:FAD-binding PCMH-type domain-containing protein n=1 Tax=Neoarthrinium moseri TaxID=1658444 RepID=A0A9Q0AUF9_9PEZI|nr:hypothetical protein JX265_003307 [Neoarthrinium moseri]
MLLEYSLVQGLLGALLLAPTTVATPYSRNHRRRDEYVWPTEVADQAHDSSWPDFVNKTTRWSTYEPPSFNEVFLPENVEDLSIGLKYLSGAGKTFLAKSGGHGYSPTLHAIQDAVMINLENFDYVTVNEDLSVTLGTGAKFSELVEVVGNAGRELTVGACPCVGAMGAMLGGGLGRFQGLHGLTSDALRSARVALWNGTIVEASADVNQDLFWGLRGAGQNFGVVIDAIFETYAATNGGQQYSSDMTFSADKLEAVFDVTNQLLSDGLDPALALAIAIGSNPVTLEPLILVNVVYPGPEEKGQEYARLYSNFSDSMTEQMTAWTNLANVALPSVVISGCPTGNQHNQYSIMTKDLKTEHFREALESYRSFVQQHPTANNSVIFIETFGQAGIKAFPDDFSAFPHRNQFDNAVVFSMTYADVSVAEDADAWALQWRDHFAQPEVSGYDKMVIYQNYAHDDEPLSALYGYDGWRHERLSALKKSYDPQGLFNGYHAVPADLAGWS